MAKNFVSSAALTERLRRSVSDAERAALARGGEGLCISAFNRDVMLRMLTGFAVPETAIPVAGVRELTEDLTDYLQKYMPDRPEGHKWVILACLYLTFVEKVPMHPQEAAKWRYTGGGYVCPSRNADSVTCRYCVCR